MKKHKIILLFSLTFLAFSTAFGQAPGLLMDAFIKGSPAPSAMTRTMDEIQPPDLFQFNQSQAQAFYFIQYVYNDAGPYDLEVSADWFGAFNPFNDVCVGARLWMGDFSEIPVMGDEGADYTEGYMNAGVTPYFQLYDASSGLYYSIDHHATAPPWAPNLFGTVDLEVTDLLPGQGPDPDPDPDPEVDFEMLIQVRAGIPYWNLVD